MSFKLVTYEATNLIGYESGMTRKHVKIDFWPFYEYDIVILAGGNGMGKSVFLSTCSPLYTPTDKRKMFIKPKKEGILLREYYSKETQTLIRVKQIYTPNKDKNTHATKAYFQLIKNVFGKDDEQGEATELNPNGNIESYMDLLKMYFGIDKNFITLASYNEDIKGMVKMTSSERYECMRTIIPNTERLMLAYDGLNSKYKDTLAIIKSIADKIARIRPETTLVVELDRVEREINKLNNTRDSANVKLSMLSGRIKEIQSGVDKDIVSHCDKLYNEKYKLEVELEEIRKSLNKLKKILGYDKNSNLRQKEKQLLIRSSAAKSKLALHHDTKEVSTELLYKLETERTEIDASLYSYTNFDISDLEELVNNIRYRISSLEYTKQKDKYLKKDFKEAESFLTLLNTLDTGLSAIDENYSGVLRDVFANKTFIKCEDPVTFIYNQDNIKRRLLEYTSNMDRCNQNISSTNKEIMEITSYQKLEERLNFRPKECTIDSCAFIRDAIRSVELRPALAVLVKELSTLENDKKVLQNQIEYLHLIDNALTSYETIRPIIINSGYLFDTYLGTSLQKFFKMYSNNNLFEFIQSAERTIKSQMEILSQKDLYIELITETLPETESLLQRAQADKNIITTLNNKRKSLCKEIDNIKASLKQISFNIGIESRIVKESNEEIDSLTEYISYKELYDNTKDLLNEVKDAYSHYSDKASKIIDYMKTIDNLTDDIKKLDNEFKPLIIKRDCLRYEQLELVSLSQERAVVDRDFVIYDILRGFVKPGKKIWKILSQVYMHDVKTNTNLLLEQTFDGNLSLDDINLEGDFIIPYTFNGFTSRDISYASSSQQTTISNCLSLAMLAVLLNKYGIITLDEIDKDLSPEYKTSFITTITTNVKKMGIQQTFISTHNLDYYRDFDNAGFLAFPGAKIPKKYEYKTIAV